MTNWYCTVLQINMSKVLATQQCSVSDGMHVLFINHFLSGDGTVADRNVYLLSHTLDTSNNNIDDLLICSTYILGSSLSLVLHIYQCMCRKSQKLSMNFYTSVTKKQLCIISIPCK